VIALIGRALFALLCAMTAPRPPIPDLPPVQPRPEPPPSVGMCIHCGEQPCRDGSDFFCGDSCQRDWTAAKNSAIPLEATPPTLPDGSQYRRTP
jgi:hypothetical protein